MELSNKISIFTKSGLRIAIGLVIAALVMVVYMNRLHKANLLEVSRTSSFVGCIQVTGSQEYCAMLAANTNHDNLIQDVLSSKDNEGEIIIDLGKQLIEGMPKFEEKQEVAPEVIQNDNSEGESSGS